MSCPSIAVVICAYDERRWAILAQAVDNVRKQLGPTDELVVVIDHNDTLLRRANQAWGGSDALRVLPNAGGRGLSGGRNTGVNCTAAEVVAFLDDDAVPRPGWLDGLRLRFARDNASVVGGAVVPRWPDGVPPRWFPEEFGWVVGCDYRGLPGDGAEIRNPIGASMAIAREAFGLAGGFSERMGRTGELPTGCEETELGIRIRRVLPDRPMLRDTSAVVDHVVPPTRANPRYFVRRCWNEGRSKAALSRIAGTGQALSSERKHAARLVTSGPLRHLAAAGRGDLAGLARAWWCLAGLAVTAAGYLGARASGLSQVTGEPDPGPAPGAALDSAHGVPERDGFVPIPVVDLDLADPAKPLPGHDRAGVVQVLARSHGWPVGQVRVRFERAPRDRDDWLAAVAAADPALTEYLDRPAPPASPARAIGPAVSVVVCTLGRNPLLTSTVAAVLGQRSPVRELLVVDNDPGSGRVAGLLGGVDDPRLRIVAEARRGASHARNAGARAAAGTVLAFTDDDAVPDPDWTARLAATLTAHEAIGCVTGLVVPAGLESREQLRFEEYGGFGKGFRLTHWFAGDARALTGALDAVAGAAGSPHPSVPGRRGAAFPYTAGEFGSGIVALRADTFAELGGFDPALGPGTPTFAGEDLDLCRRVYLAGLAVVYQPAAVVRHHHREDPGALRQQVFGYGVGLTAALAKLLLTRPRHALGFAARIPAALHMLLAPGSKKNAALPADFPGELLRVERRGIIAGPGRYLRSRWAVRR